MFAPLPECGCTLACSAPKSCFRAVDGELLNDIDIFAAAIPALLRIALGVFVGEHRALRFHHGRAGEIFAGDELDVFLLPLLLQQNGVGNFGIHRAQAQCLGVRRFHFAHAPFVASALEPGSRETRPPCAGPSRRRCVSRRCKARWRRCAGARGRPFHRRRPAPRARREFCSP